MEPYSKCYVFSSKVEANFLITDRFSLSKEDSLLKEISENIPNTTGTGAFLFISGFESGIVLLEN